MKTPRESSRRDFLQGKAAADALVDLTSGGHEGNAANVAPGAGADSPSLAPPVTNSASGVSAGCFLSQLGRAAMACQFEFYFNGGQYPRSTAAGIEALDLIEQLEEQLSVYREQSEVSRLNRMAAFASVAVEPGLFALLVRAGELSAATDGAFDITSSPLSKVWGFHRRAGRIPGEEESSQALELVGWKQILLDPAARSVRFDKPGVELSLNSIGKGYALDRAADLLQCQGVCDFMLHGGQSSVLAAGAHAATPDRGWTIGLRHPLRPEARLAEFYLRNEALATSGTGRQHFYHQGQRFGHILDPRSGQPAEGARPRRSRGRRRRPTPWRRRFMCWGPPRPKRIASRVQGWEC